MAAYPGGGHATLIRTRLRDKRRAVPPGGPSVALDWEGAYPHAVMMPNVYPLYDLIHVCILPNSPKSY